MSATSPRLVIVNHWLDFMSGRQVERHAGGQERHQRDQIGQEGEVARHGRDSRAGTDRGSIGTQAKRNQAIALIP